MGNNANYLYSSLEIFGIIGNIESTQAFGCGNGYIVVHSDVVNPMPLSCMS